MTELGMVPATILLVDDDPISIRLLRSILKDDGEVIFATNGEEAIRLAQTQQPDVILLDAEMPGLDGFAVCERLKQDEVTARSAVIFVTAHNDTERETRALDIGAVDFITKPVSPPIVKARVRAHIKLKQQGDHLRRLAAVDGLTGIANRRVFDETLARELKRAGRSRHPLGLVLLDVDFFKLYNDRYGHLEGDACLRAVAQALHKLSRRPADTVARYGGEEFALILPDIDRPGVEQFGGIICDTIRNLKLPHEASKVHEFVTVSVGLALLPGGAEVTSEAMIRKADELLYQAKLGGRDRFIVGDIA
ncbi:diguanylate cyclase domain-containing protein [Lacibacterium aquatile]|uniref:diguanylate cyclase n=1 Tax=Lacibacterium aquatile TaxID=1168082 RepID=A0ABW5DQ48_9PROT